MKLQKTKTEVAESRSFPGLIECELKHKLQSTTAKAAYVGPRIPEEEWHKILSFFRWTHQTTHSESQVRLYVNTKTNTWAAWAYPQEARTGMSAREIDDDESKAQRQQFKDSDGWMYFGTVHHHCGCGAFQSGTDQANEENQDGLHITIGKIDEKRHEMHCRFYLKSYCFDPDMDAFWDIGDEARALVPEPVWDLVARYQMCEVFDVPFPDKWKENLIEIKSVQTYTYQGGMGYHRSWPEGEFSHNKTGGAVGGSSTPGDYKLSQPIYVRQRRAVQTIMRHLAQTQQDFMEVGGFIGELSNDPTWSLILDTMVEEGVEIRDLWVEWPNEFSPGVAGNPAYPKEKENWGNNKGKGKKRKGGKLELPPVNTEPYQAPAEPGTNNGPDDEPTADEAWRGYTGQ